MVIQAVRSASELGDADISFREGAIFTFTPRRHSSPISLVRDLLLRHVPEDMASAIGKALALLEDAEVSFHGGEAHLHEAQNVLPLYSGVAAALHHLGVEAIAFDVLEAGSGRISFSHGEFDLPAPATRHILKRLGVVYTCERKGEWTTPTGAALLGAFPRVPMAAEAEYRTGRSGGVEVRIALRE